MHKTVRYYVQEIFFHTVLLSANPLFLQGTPDMKSLLSKFEDKAGYNITAEEQQKIHGQGWSPTYGEITPEGASMLIKEYKLNGNDVFYDLGCGVGKLVFQVLLEGGVKKSIGIELSPTRIKYAKDAQEKLKDILSTHKCGIIDFLEQNMLDADLSDATALYVASTCFSDDVMTQLAKKLSTLKPGLRLVTLTKLPTLYNFRLDKQLTIPMTWSPNSTAYVYILEPEKPQPNTSPSA